MSFEAVRALLDGAGSVVFLTGAGISAESGVPTFRGEGGLWKSYRAEELATPEAFARDPRLVWEWYGWRRELVQKCAPNAGHLAIARWAGRHAGVSLVTQNVDGLHGLAKSMVEAELGHAVSLPMAELHGNLFKVRSTVSGTVYAHREVIDASSMETLPRDGAGDLMRPHIVWFGESLDEGVITSAVQAVEGADVVVVVGTSSLVYPAAALPLYGLRAGAKVVEVNVAETPLTGKASYFLQGKAGEVLAGVLGG